jgi:hypothetical protein
VPETMPIYADWIGTIAVPGLRSESDAHTPVIDLNLPASVSSAQARLIGGAARNVRVLPTEGLEGALFKNRANLKIIASQVAMHLNSEERRNLFSAIDRLLNITEWEDESSQINENAFRSYLRFTIYARPRRIPNLGVSPDGMLLAGWHNGDNSVHVEFFSNDQCMSLLRSNSVRGLERIAWRGHVARLREIIQNNNAVDCID